MKNKEAIEALEMLLEDLHNAITIEPTGLSLGMGQCIDLYDKLKPLTQEPITRGSGCVWCDTGVQPDVKDLKNVYGNPSQQFIQGAKEQIGWNACIDHLAEKGLLGVPEGMCLVPVKYTKKMHNIIDNSNANHYYWEPHWYDFDEMKEVWAVLIKAAESEE